MTIEVVLGVEGRELAAKLTGRFRELPDIDVLAVEGTSDHLAGTVATAQTLDVVLVHQDLGPLPALDLIRDMMVRRPQLAIILIAREATADTLSAAMAAGARGVISAEPTLAELQNGVRQAADWSRAMRSHFTSAEATGTGGGQGRLITLCGAKGGVGTTTLAIHLAIAASDAGQTVCLIDMDLQNGDIPGFLDVQHRHSIADLAAAAGDLDGAVVAEALFVHPSGPHLLLAPGHGEDAEEISARAVRQILTVVRSRYDVVIVDGGTHVADANAIAVELADEAVIVATPDVPALRSARRLAGLFARLTIRKEEDMSVLLTRHDKRNEIQPDLARKMVGSPLRGVTVPAAFRALEEAANTGSPGAVKNSDFRKAVGRIAADLGLVRGAGGGPAPGGRTGPERARTAGPLMRQPGDRGVAAVEFAAVLPLIMLVFLLCVQVVMVGLTSTYAGHAANEAARAVAVLGYDESDTEQGRANREEVRRRAVARIAGAWKDREHLSIRVRDGFAVVTIDTPVLLPGLRSSWDITAETKIVDEGEG